jgi:glutamyl-tRNA reductase
MQGKLQSLSDEQRGAVEALTRGLINKVLHQPLQAMKAAARDGDLTVVEAVQQIFGLSSRGVEGLSSQGSELASASEAAPPKEAPPEKAETEASEPSRPLEATRH